MRRLLALGMMAAIAVAQSILPGLRLEAVDTGSLLFVKNRAALPLTAFLIELVDYPGSSFTHLHDDLAEPVAPGAEKRIAVSNMLPGAVPDYVKLQAAIFADGSTAGAPEKVAVLLERRRGVLQATREAIRLIAPGTDKGAIVAALRQWADSARTPSVRGVAESAVNRLTRATVADALEALRRSEAMLARSKPPL
jgi:hypothetical protein